MIINEWPNTAAPQVQKAESHNFLRQKKISDKNKLRVAKEIHFCLQILQKNGVFSASPEFCIFQR